METNLGFPYPESETAAAFLFLSFVEIRQGKTKKILLYSRILVWNILQKHYCSLELICVKMFEVLHPLPLR